MRIYTIGFTQKSARKFFGLIKDSGASRVVDVRLNNVSQLAGFAKRDDLAYFSEAVCGVDYVHRTELAPTQEMLDSYKKHRSSWAVYEQQFLDLMEMRKIETTVAPELLENGCLLCSEDKPHQCHRRLVAEYLREKWGGIEIRHLG